MKNVAAVEPAVGENVQPSTMKEYTFSTEDQVRIVYATVAAESEEAAIAKVVKAYPESDGGQEDVGDVAFSFDYVDACCDRWIPDGGDWGVDYRLVSDPNGREIIERDDLRGKRQIILKDEAAEVQP